MYMRRDRMCYKWYKMKGNVDIAILPTSYTLGIWNM